MVSNATGLSASKHVPLWELLWFSLVANISIAAMNFSLMLNSVGFYQVKLLFDFAFSQFLNLAFKMVLLIVHIVFDFNRYRN